MRMTQLASNLEETGSSNATLRNLGWLCWLCSVSKDTPVSLGSADSKS